MKNLLAPINQLPPEVLSVIPDFYYKDDQDLVALTHVCRSWRDTFTSRPALWTQLNFTNVDKTRAYIQRSQSSPLEFFIEDDKALEDAFALVIPHIGRLKSLTINAEVLPSILEHFYCHTPLLERLDIDISFLCDPILNGALFAGQLSSLRELCLHRVVTHLPWKNLENLRVVDLKSYLHRYKTTELLDFFESAPLLHTVKLENSIQDPSDAPPERIVPLRHLKFFTMYTESPHSILLNHLHIPIGASVTLKFRFGGDESPLLEYLPERSPNSNNLSHITAINILFDSARKFTQLSGPTGSLRVLAVWEDWRDPDFSSTLHHRILRSFGPPILSTTQKLAISGYGHSGPDNVEECPIFQTFSFTNHLRTLSLTNCDNLPFTRALDPEQNPSNLVLCLNMKELVLYVQRWYLLDLEHLIKMAKNRALRGAKLSSITIVGPSHLAPETEVSKLQEYITHVEYRTDGFEPPAWDEIPGESDGGVREVV